MHLGIDIGTSGVKALLMSDEGTVVCSFDAPLQVSRPHPGWSEQNPDDWITATQAAIGQVAAAEPEAFAKLQSIGLSGQMHGATLLGKDGKPLRPCILWNDGRSGAECAELEERADFRGIGGNIVMAGFTAPKLRWVEKYEPEIFALVDKVLLPKDYVRLWLTGEYVAEMSDAAGTLWLDVAGRCWSPELLEASGLSEAHMPSLVDGTQQSGTLRAEIASQWGVGQVPVAGGGGDNAATACGMGILSPGTGFLSLGTSGVLFAATDSFAPNTSEAVHAFCHAVPEKWHQMGVILAAVDSLNWLGRMLGADGPALAAELPERVEKPSEAMFLPYLSGERTPHNDPSARGAFTGLSIACERTTLTQAVMEGVAFAFADCCRALANAGTPVEAAYAVGGGARSPQWLQIIASATGLRLLIPEAGDFGAAYGAARLGKACLCDSFDASIFAMPAIQSEIAPDPALAGQYAPLHERFRSLYGAVMT